MFYTAEAGELISKPSYFAQKPISWILQQTSEGNQEPWHCPCQIIEVLAEKDGESDDNDEPHEPVEQGEASSTVVNGSNTFVERTHQHEYLVPSQIYHTQPPFVR